MACHGAAAALMWLCAALLCSDLADASCRGHDSACEGSHGTQANCCEKLYCHKTNPEWRQGRCYSRLGESSGTCVGHDQTCRGEHGTQSTCCQGLYCHKPVQNWLEGRCYNRAVKTGNCVGHDQSCRGDHGTQSTCCQGLYCHKPVANWLEGRCYNRAVDPGSSETEEPSPPEECGVAPLPPTMTVNGERVEPGAFPWHAAIYHRRGNLICGGSLISAQFVVTAAHCFYDDGELQSADQFAVGLGKIKSGWSEEEYGHVHKSFASRLLVHERYRGDQESHAADVALLKMRDSASVADNINIICVNENIALSSGEYARVVGWGNGDAPPLPVLASVLLQVKTYDDCRNIVDRSSWDARYLSRDKFCAVKDRGAAWHGPGLDRGDSGGGVVVKRNGLWYLAGIVSTAITSNLGDRMFAFTDMRQHGDWVNRNAA